MIYITGDLHGDFQDSRMETILNLTENDYFIVCGDFGFNWDKQMIEVYRNFVKTKGTILFVDGNHENFDILNSLPTKKMFGDDVGVFCEDENNHTYHLRRGGMYEIAGKKFFCFGGASSIDKPFRLLAMKRGNPKCWWEEETPTYKDLDNALDTLKKYNYTFDYFITHSCTPELKSIVLGTYKKDFFDNTELMIQNLELTIKENNGSYAGHFFGHFHVDCGCGSEHCLYHNTVNLSEGYIITGSGKKYKFDVSGNPSHADFGVEL